MRPTIWEVLHTGLFYSEKSHKAQRESKVLGVGLATGSESPTKMIVSWNFEATNLQQHLNLIRRWGGAFTRIWGIWVGKSSQVNLT